MKNDESLRFPTGRFAPKDAYAFEELQAFIDRIEALPARLRSATESLTQEQLDTPYRDGGWTLRQVIHHLADSHTNAYTRLKWSLTESTPTIKAYDEKGWAETPETKADPEVSLRMVEALHARWVMLLRALRPEDFEKGYIHPDTGKFVSLGHQVALYAWHGEHHLAHLGLVAPHVQPT
ncbi:MAG TPA: putative metal-dependent hydrolase [Cyclobacteriaceae bacterium]